MVWAQLDINRPHLVYIILGGFTSLFMLCSSVIKERFYIGEATIATICGIIFGPHAANLIDPGTWGNTDQITLEFSRIVLVVQCFAVGVELPKAYMERHWRSVVLLLVPVMTFGWLVTSLFIWALIPGVNWLDSLTVAACVTATDPVLASSVVGKGKFAKRVPRHLRDLLSAESGCNDGMAFPFIYLALYILQYRNETHQVSLHWFCYTILYECIFGAFYGVCVGYIARRAIRAAHKRDLIDRESFLVFYFVLALFCAGSGSMLGMDDLLIGFACGVGFSNDGWFTAETEESHVSNVIDLLINLAFFVYFGTIIPWEQFNAEHIFGLTAWRLVVIGLLVMLFRRIPIMLALKPIIPDVKTWREALFAGHFGPIGVGAIFVAILARAELETDTTTPLEVIPTGHEHQNIIELIWPVTTFLVICSIVVHGSSIAVFTLGKHINTFTLTMSYTTQNEEQSWLDRLPRIQSRSRSSMSARRPDDLESLDEKFDLPAGVVPRNFLRRQRTEDTPDRASSRRQSRKRQGETSRYRHGGPISQSAIGSLRSPAGQEPPNTASDSDTLAMKSEQTSPEDSMEKQPSSPPDEAGEDEAEIFEEGQETVYEDEEGNVLEVEDSREYEGENRQQHEIQEGERLMREKDVHHGVARTEDDPNVDMGEKVLHAVTSPFRGHKEAGKGGNKKDGKESGKAGDREGVRDRARDGARESAKDGGEELAREETREAADRPRNWRRGLSRMGTAVGNLRKQEERPAQQGENRDKQRVPARAYQFGNTVVIEDEDGEVLKKYEVKKPQKPQNTTPTRRRQRMDKMSSYLGVRPKDEPGPSNPGGEAGHSSDKKGRRKGNTDQDDDKIRFTLESGGKRMNRDEFMDQLKSLDPKSRAKVVEASNAPEAVKREARADAQEYREERDQGAHPDITVTGPTPGLPQLEDQNGNDEKAKIKQVGSNEDTAQGPEGLTLVDSNNQDLSLIHI